MLTGPNLEITCVASILFLEVNELGIRITGFGYGHNVVLRFAQVVHFRQDGDQFKIQTGRVDVTGVEHGNVRDSTANCLKNCEEIILIEFIKNFKNSRLVTRMHPK